MRHMAVVAFILFSGSVAVAGGPIRNLRAWEESEDVDSSTRLVVTCNCLVSSDDKPEFREAAVGSDSKILQLELDISEPPRGKTLIKRLWFEKKIKPLAYSKVQVRIRDNHDYYQTTEIVTHCRS
jgi:hypothetical protein